jgi:hypothetical protein
MGCPQAVFQQPAKARLGIQRRVEIYMRIPLMNRRIFGVVLLGIANAACAGTATFNPTMLSLTGVLIEGGAECQLFQADDGAQYTLLGDLKGFKNGDKVQLSGEEAEISFCMQGKTLSVKAIGKVK